MCGRVAKQIAQALWNLQVARGYEMAVFAGGYQPHLESTEGNNHYRHDTYLLENSVGFTSTAVTSASWECSVRQRICRTVYILLPPFSPGRTITVPPIA